MRLVTFVISAAGAISPDAQGLLAAVSRCSGGSLFPSSLYPLSSWSASRLIPYVRQAVIFNVRCHLAACVCDAYSSAEAAPWLSPVQDALPPVPLLDSSDALDVVDATPPGARLSRLLLSQGSCPVPLPSSGVPCCSMWVLVLPLVLVCPSKCSSVCSSFRSPCVRRPSALSPLFYVFRVVKPVPCVCFVRVPDALSQGIWSFEIPLQFDANQENLGEKNSYVNNKKK
jgi:hypothetical protein